MPYLSVSYNIHFDKVWHSPDWLIHASLSLSDYTMTIDIDQHFILVLKRQGYGNHIKMQQLYE